MNRIMPYFSLCEHTQIIYHTKDYFCHMVSITNSIYILFFFVINLI